MNVYSYNGPVMEFDKCIEHDWKAETTAVSEKKAKSNLIYQYKVATNRSPRSKITLPGKINLVQ